MPRTRLYAFLAVGLALTSAAFAGGPRAGEPPAATRVKAIEADVADALAVYQQAWGKQTDRWPQSPEVQKLLEVYLQKHKAGRDEAMEIARADPASAGGFAAMEWLLSEPAYTSPYNQSAMELMARHHATNPAIGKIVAFLGPIPPISRFPVHATFVALLKTVAEKNPDRTARGQAALGLAYQAKGTFEVDEFEALEGGLKDPVKVAAADRAAAEAERAYETVVRDYGDCPNLRAARDAPAEATLSAKAGNELYELRHLRIGKTAPDVAAEDLDGTRFKLSDYRGKVVLLVFWASWCSPCMAEVPHEKELVERLKGRPFVLIGVNGDEDKRIAVRTVARDQIPWRSFWNGPDRTVGSGVATYNVRGWPTVYIIDPQGVIRAKGLREKALDGPLEELVAEAEAAKGR